MSLTAGTHIGAYEVVAPLGAGGMGEVYRARDGKLNREVALKVLPESFVLDPDRLARFRREAQVLASLNHPNIGAIYGFEEGDNIQALVLELVDGPTLADRLAQGRIPLEEALPIVKQIAEALEGAHEQGIIHRDLKPANIKLRKDGTVKVLDFGLAKALTGDGSVQSAPLTNSPTLTNPVAVTGVGVLLGTAAYMSPEQATGQSADRRADIWSFGAVLFEMLSGSQAFGGESVSDTLAAVLKVEPDWTALPVSTPRPILELLRRCLTKDRKLRLQAIGEARIALEHAKDEPAASTGTNRVAPQLGWAAAAVLLLALSALAFIHFREPPAPERTLRYAITLPDNGAIHSFAISPDGRSVAIAAIANGRQQLWLRTLDALQARLLPTTEDAAYPFWSPDSRYVGFFAQGKLKKIAVSNGPSQSICEASFSARGASWSREDVILFAQVGTASGGVRRVHAAGGVPTEVDPTGGTYRFPVFLPNGRRFLYYDIQQTDIGNGGGLYVRSLDGAENRQLLADSSAAVFAPASSGSPTGHLLFIRENNLMAMPFDAEIAQPFGEAFPVVEGVSTSRANAGYAPVSVSENGLLVYSTGQTGGNTNQISQYDRGGRSLGTIVEAGALFMPAISVDEKVMAYTRATGGNFDVWFRDLARGIDTRFTAGGLNFASVWSPKGDRLLFTRGAGGFGRLHLKAVIGSGEAEGLSSVNDGRSEQWSRDGRFIVVTRRDPKTREDLWFLPMEEAPSSDRNPKLFLQTEFSESQGQLSPDSRWMAYTSNESGERNVYVRAFPSGESKRRVSTSGGEQPRWRGDGKELFYIALDGKVTGVIMAATPAVGLEPGVPTALFDSHLSVSGNASQQLFQYDVTADGKRFVIVEPVDSDKGPPTLTAVVNWSAALKK